MKKILMIVAGAFVLASCSPKGTVTKGSLSQMDSLSYAMGCNIAYTTNFQFQALPIDNKAFAKGMVDGAYDEAKVKPEEAQKMLEDYFRNKYQAREAAIMAKRHEADSIRLAQGDSTAVEYPAADPEMFESEQEREQISYALGADAGNYLRQSDVPLQTVWIEKAYMDVKEGTPVMDQQASMSYLQTYFMDILPANNLAESEAWLKKIESKSGVQKTESGLLYKVIKAGDPELMPTDDRDVVKVHYRGELRTGKVFDASRYKDMPKERQEMMKKHYPEGFDKDDPIEFPLNGVIKGWTEGMKHVGKGGKIQLWIPSELAYGAHGSRGAIGPNEALFFEVDLIDVTPYAEETEESEPVEEPAAAEE